MLVPNGISLKLYVCRLCRTVSDIFGVKKQSDLETGGRSRSR